MLLAISSEEAGDELVAGPTSEGVNVSCIKAVACLALSIIDCMNLE